MSKQNFINISRTECLNTYKEVLENSNKKWESSKVLSFNKDYGMAISTSIISIEELIKSIIILLDGKGFDFRKVKGMNNFFRNHEIRYVIAYFMFVGSLVGDELIKLMKTINENPDKVNQFLKESREGNFFSLMKLRFYFLRKGVLLRKELLWFSKVDLFRQEGFYCDYDDRFKNPIEISENDFFEVQERLEKVRKVGLFLIEEAVNNHLEIEKLREQFKEENFYEKIEKTLEGLRTDKKKPFEALKETFSIV